MTKSIDIEKLLQRVESLEKRVEKLDPTSKRQLPSKEKQIKNIKDEIEIWSKKFPSIDVEFELIKMLDWLKANNKRKKDYKAFFRNWLRKSSNSIEQSVEDVLKYVYGCTKPSKNCLNNESDYKDMYIFCEICKAQKTIIKTIKN